MSLTSLHSSLLARIAGFLDTPDKASFARTCKATALACVDDPGAWWSGPETDVAISSRNAFTFADWAAAACRWEDRRPSWGSGVVIRCLRVEYHMPSMFFMLACVFQPRSIVIDGPFTTMLTDAMRPFQSVRELTLVLNSGIHRRALIEPRNLPPRLVTLSLIAYTKLLHVDLRLSPGVKHLHLRNIQLASRGLHTHHLDTLTVKDSFGLYFNTDVDEERLNTVDPWLTLDVQRLIVEGCMTEDEDYDAVLDEQIPWLCYPAALRDLTFVVTHRGPVYLSPFTPRSVPDLRSFTIRNYGATLAFPFVLSSDRSKNEIDGFKCPNTDFSIVTIV